MRGRHGFRARRLPEICLPSRLHLRREADRGHEDASLSILTGFFFRKYFFKFGNTRNNNFRDLGEFFTIHVDRFVDPIQQRLANLKYNG